MTQFKALLIAFLAFTSMPTFAQIAKGNYNFGGDAALTADWKKSEFYQNLQATASINPSFNKFITDKWLVGVQPRLSASTEKYGFGKLNALSQPIQQFNRQDLGLGITARYYFSKVENIHFFGRVGLEVTQNHYVMKNTFSGETQSKVTNLNYGIGFGADIFLNPEVALEPIFSYTSYHTQYNQTGLNLPITDNSKYDLFSLTVKFNNFLNLSVKTDAKAPPQYIGINRRISGGQAYLNGYKFGNETITNYSFAPQFGQFITPHILLKGTLALFGSSRSKITAVNTTVAARYYLPLGKRFFMYPELNATYFTGNGNSFFVFDNLNNPSPNTLMAGLSIGGSYFLSENVALDMSFSQTRVYFGKSPVQYVTSSLGVGNIGLLYFIR